MHPQEVFTTALNQGCANGGVLDLNALQCIVFLFLLF
jgi:hypothetical protein